VDLWVAVDLREELALVDLEASLKGVEVINILVGVCLQQYSASASAMKKGKRRKRRCKRK
jgi:hypothetical protein